MDENDLSLVLTVTFPMVAEAGLLQDFL